MAKQRSVDNMPRPFWELRVISYFEKMLNAFSMPKLEMRKNDRRNRIGYPVLLAKSPFACQLLESSPVGSGTYVRWWMCCACHGFIWFHHHAPPTAYAMMTEAAATKSTTMTIATVKTVASPSIASTNSQWVFNEKKARFIAHCQPSTRNLCIRKEN